MTSVVSENPELKTAIRVLAPLAISEETSEAKALACTAPQSQSVGWQLPQACTWAELPETSIFRLVMPRVAESTFDHDPAN